MIDDLDIDISDAPRYCSGCREEIFNQDGGFCGDCSDKAYLENLAEEEAIEEKILKLFKPWDGKEPGQVMSTKQIEEIISLGELWEIELGEQFLQSLGFSQYIIGNRLNIGHVNHIRWVVTPIKKHCASCGNEVHDTELEVCDTCHNMKQKGYTFCNKSDVYVKTSNKETCDNCDYPPGCMP